MTDGPFVEAKEIVGGYMMVDRRELRQRARGRAGNARDDDAGIEHRDPGDGGLTGRSNRASGPPPGLVEHFFRHEYGRLVAMLARRVGVQHLEVVEDAVQSALMTALDGLDAARAFRMTRARGCTGSPTTG